MLNEDLDFDDDYDYYCDDDDYNEWADPIRTEAYSFDIDEWDEDNLSDSYYEDEDKEWD